MVIQIDKALVLIYYCVFGVGLTKYHLFDYLRYNKTNMELVVSRNTTIGKWQCINSKRKCI